MRRVSFLSQFFLQVNCFILYLYFIFFKNKITWRASIFTAIQLMHLTKNKNKNKLSYNKKTENKYM